MGLACSSWTQALHRGKVSLLPLRTGKTGWKNVHSGDTKIRPQGLVDGQRDNLRMTNKVRAVLVHPRVKGGHIHVAYFLALPSHSMQGHRFSSPPPPPKKKASRGSRGGTRSNERRN